MTQVEWAGYLASQISMLLAERETMVQQIQALSEENARQRAELEGVDTYVDTIQAVKTS